MLDPYAVVIDVELGKYVVIVLIHQQSFDYQ